MRITAEASRSRVYVIPTGEEKMIAEHTLSPTRAAVGPFVSLVLRKTLV
jgi:hypothetical protein